MKPRSSELLPCPFCDSSKDCTIFTDEGRSHGMCWGCLCRTKDYDSKEEAIKAWNTRPKPSVKTKENKKLKTGEPCNHPGCLSHVSHPCEGCGRVAGRYLPYCAAVEAAGLELIIRKERG